MKAVAEEVVRKTTADMNNKLLQKTKQMRDYVDGQLKGAPLDQSNGSMPDVSASLRSGIQSMMAGQGLEDFKTKQLKRTL